MRLVTVRDSGLVVTAASGPLRASHSIIYTRGTARMRPRLSRSTSDIRPGPTHTCHMTCHRMGTILSRSPQSYMRTALHTPRLLQAGGHPITAEAPSDKATRTTSSARMARTKRGVAGMKRGVWARSGDADGPETSARAVGTGYCGGDGSFGARSVRSENRYIFRACPPPRQDIPRPSGIII